MTISYGYSHSITYNDIYYENLNYSSNKRTGKSMECYTIRCNCKKNHEVKIFLMGEAVECEGLIHEKYNVDEQLTIFASLGGEILACGTCLKSRNKEGSDICPLSTMMDCLKVVEWADKMLTF